MNFDSFGILVTCVPSLGLHYNHASPTVAVSYRMQRRNPVQHAIYSKADMEFSRSYEFVCESSGLVIALISMGVYILRASGRWVGGCKDNSREAIVAV